MKRSALLLLIAALPAALTTARRGPEDESVFVRGLRPDQREAVRSRRRVTAGSTTET